MSRSVALGSVTDNCHFGVFASHDSDNGQQGVVELVFSDLELYRNKSAGFNFATTITQGSVDNVLMSTRITRNAAGEAILRADATGLQEFANLIFDGASTGPTNRTCP